jgi:hypothetical protein
LLVTALLAACQPDFEAPAVVKSKASALDVFQPYQCAPCNTWTQLNWSYVVGIGSSSELPLDRWNPAHYINALHYTRVISANRYVKKLAFSLQSFQTETGWDWLDFGEYGQSLTRLSGSGYSGWQTPIAVSGSLQSTPAIVQFHSDYSVTGSGFSIDKVRVCCQQELPTTATPLQRYKRHVGLLLGTNDVVYFSAPPSGTLHSTFTLRGQPGRDFNLYVRCGNLPTPTVYDYASTSTSSNEHVHIPYNACQSTYYIAVNSHGGSGWFDLWWQDHYASQHMNLRAGTNFAASSNDMTNMAGILLRTGRHYFGTTEGTGYIERIDLYNSNTTQCGGTSCGGAACDFCFHAEPNQIGACGGVIRCGPGPVHRWLPNSVDEDCATHELGHRYQCGHSMMSYNYAPANHNVCYTQSVGVRADHGYDRDSIAPFPDYPSTWDVMYTHGVTPWKPDETPDNYDFVDFTALGSVVQH